MSINSAPSFSLGDAKVTTAAIYIQVSVAGDFQQLPCLSTTLASMPPDRQTENFSVRGTREIVEQTAPTEELNAVPLDNSCGSGTLG